MKFKDANDATEISSENGLIGVIYRSIKFLMISLLSMICNDEKLRR